MSHEVIRGIVRHCSENCFFSIIADESTDISGKQQFSISLCYVAQDFTLHEEFFGLYEVNKADADHLSKMILVGLVSTSTYYVGKHTTVLL